MLVAGGGASAQPSECRATKKKRLKDAKAAAKEADIRVLLALWWGGTIPRVSLRCALGYEPLAALGRSTFQVVLRFFYHGFFQIV